ncbi:MULTISPECIES: ABC transporter substrate-binding protein [Alteribacter]|uniref:Extracellular solute-binding protein n=1 Tax=Alteribacter keqinensis TaxID=2483800 RepID=A0A3M7TQ07_9BACI|nr:MULTISPECIES: ABC transporter substrate-binding protein [Alteribacter]MBM7095691.1 extracellular solute-binding protein [Alteribacter salitolerans]RNA67724.1 extracellular solute-binding protein [Alteribacter keqinensis]
MKKAGFLASSLAVLTVFAAACGAEDDASGESSSNVVTVYSPHQSEIINPIVREFQERSGIEVDLVTGGTGELLNRVQAESNNPGGDVFWGGGAESLEAYNDYFEPYVTSEDDSIPEEYKSPTNHWTGFSALPMVIMYNEEMVSEEDAPTSWEDLLDEQWKGKIAYTDPGRSGSSYTQLVTMLFAYEENGEKGWDFVERFVENLDGTMLSGSSMVFRGIADGEFPIGITLEEAAHRYIAGGSPVNVAYPEEGTSAVPDGMALVKDSKNSAEAQEFMDFLVSEDVQEMIVEEFNRRSIREDIDPPEGLVDSSEIPMVDYDFEWSAENQEEVMQQFQQLIMQQ